eukprot:COSAG06_NODE_3300_length_5535_cov_8.894776_7_plen_151_part_00
MVSRNCPRDCQLRFYPRAQHTHPRTTISSLTTQHHAMFASPPLHMHRRALMVPSSSSNQIIAIHPSIAHNNTATCILIAPKRLKFRLSGSARKSQKRFRDTPMFKFQAVLARTQPFLSRSVEKRGDQSQFKCRKKVNYYAIRSNNVECIL